MWPVTENTGPFVGNMHKCGECVASVNSFQELTVCV